MASADPFDFFKSSKRSEVAELEQELNHNKLEKRMEALKKVSYIHSQPFRLLP